MEVLTYDLLLGHLLGGIKAKEPTPVPASLLGGDGRTQTLLSLVCFV